MMADRLDRRWKERGLEAYSTEVILGTLRYYGIDTSEEQLRQVSSEVGALALFMRWIHRWRGIGAFRDLPYEAVLELWKRLGSGADRPELAERASLKAGKGLPLSFYERMAAASVRGKVRLAVDVASSDGFSEREALEVGSCLREALEEAGRYEELEWVLDKWRQAARRVHDASGPVGCWRVELALRLPGRDLEGAMRSLASRAAGAEQVQRLAEWCLFRGRVVEARAGLLAAWPQVREDEALPEWVRVDYVSRAVLTSVDVALREAPHLTAEQLRERLSAFETVLPAWFERAVALRTGRESWTGSRESLPRLSPVERFEEQRLLVLALEWELRGRHGWPWGRTQLLYPELFRLLPGPLGEEGRRDLPADMLLPTPEDVHEWVRGLAEERSLHAHAHAATALALRPWGDFLHRLGLVDEAEVAPWWARLVPVLEALPAQLGTGGDPALAEELRQVLRGG